MLKGVVDRIDGIMARVLVGEDQVGIYVPVRELPGGTHVGSVLRVQFSPDEAATRARAKKPEKLFVFDPEKPSE